MEKQQLDRCHFRSTDNISYIDRSNLIWINSAVAITIEDSEVFSLKLLTIM